MTLEVGAMGEAARGARPPRARGALLRAVRATRARRGRLALSVLLGTGAVVAAMGLLALSGWLISRASQRPQVLSLTVAIVGVRFFGIARALLRYLERLVSHDLAFRTLADLRVRFFRALVPHVPGGLRGMRRGDVLSRFVADVDRMQDLYLRAVGPPLVAAATCAVAVAATAAIHPAAAPVLLAGLALAGIGVPALTRLSARRAGRRQAAARAALTADLVEIVGGAAELAVAGREAEWSARAAAADAGLARLQARDAVAGGLASGLGTFLATGTAVAVTAVSIPSTHDGSLDGTLLAALTLLALASFEGVVPLGAAAQSIDACGRSAARIEEVTERTPPVGDPPAPVALPPEGPLTVEDARVRLQPDGPWVLDGVSLTVEPGRCVALVGRSGAGKTTLAELLVRFRDPDGGSVRIGGVDVRGAAQDSLRAAVRLASQDAHLFATSLRENLALAAPGADDAALTAALRRVGLGPWLATLPDGLATEVGERGAMLSGGQRQRIGAARLLTGGDARFLVLDEPTAHLDPTGARELLAELVRTARRERRGVLVITHGLEGLEGVDEIAVLEHGEIAERGSHAALLARGGIYAELARSA